MWANGRWRWNGGGERGWVGAEEGEGEDIGGGGVGVGVDQQNGGVDSLSSRSK